MVCGKEFPCSPSSKKITCSEECSKKNKSVKHLGEKWEEKSRKKLSKAAKERGYTDNLSHGTPAAQNSDKAGRFVSNSSAKEWTLLSPEGIEHTCINLMEWIRNNSEKYFNLPNTDENVFRIHSGFNTIKRNIKLGKSGTTYYGWTLLAWGEKKNCEREGGENE